MINLSFLFTFFAVNISGAGGTHSLNQAPQSNLKTGWYYIEDSKNDCIRQLDKSDEKYYINPNPIVTAEHFSKLEIQAVAHNGVADQYLLIRLDSIGRSAWSIATGRAIYKKLALIIDDKLVFVPQVNAQITSGVSALNCGTYSKSELEAFASKIKAEM